MSTSTAAEPTLSTRPPVITRKAAAHRLGVDTRTIDRYIERGLLVAHHEIGTRRVGVEVAGIEVIERSRIVQR